MGYKVFCVLGLALLLQCQPWLAGGNFHPITAAIADDDDDSGSDDSGDHDSDHSDDSHDSSHDSDDRGRGATTSSQSGSHSNGRSDSDKLNRVRDAVRGESLMPLWMIKARVIAQFGHQIIATEIEEKNGKRWVYEFKVIDRRGRLLEVYIDAHDGRVLEVKND